MKIIIAGGRDFEDVSSAIKKFDEFRSSLPIKNNEDIQVVSGGARGADSVGERVASFNSLNVKKFPAEWDKYGKSAGYRRNADMANYANALLAFWDGKSKGTMHMINLAKDKGLIVKVVEY